MSISVPFQPKFIGKPVKRVEDPLLLTGRARHIDDLSFPGMLHVAILRSPHAHARIRSVDCEAALSLPGVEAVLTGADAEKLTLPLPAMPSVGAGWTGYCLAFDKVRYVGEPVVAVAASSRYIAEDALEQISVDYQVLEPVVDPERHADGGSLLYEQSGTNVMFHKVYRYGDVDEAMASADVIVRGQYRFPRVSANALETFGVISQWDVFADELTCWCNAQSPGGTLRGSLQAPPKRDRIIAQPHGGSFGSKLCLRKYQLISALLSQRCNGRPVKYIEDRIEHLIASGTHAWDRRYRAEFGFQKDGRCVAMKMRVVNDCGASAENSAPSMSWKPITMLTGPYKVRHFEYDLTAVVTNKSPEGAYRGYGVTPHTLVTERLMDKAALQLRLDPAEIRRRNLIQPDEFPYRTPSGTEYDSGNYPEVLRLALETSRYEELRDEQKRRRDAGRVVGLGVVFGLEPGGVWAMTGPFREWAGVAVVNPESAAIGVNEEGTFSVEIFYALEGQGQYTFATQVVADYFGVALESVQVGQSEARDPPPSMGPAGSRQAVTLTYALIGAADALAWKLKRAAAGLLQSEPERLEVREGQIVVQGAAGGAVSIGQVAALMKHRPDLLPPDVDGNPQASFTWRAAERPADAEGSPYLTYANACHVVLVEIDKGTGVVTIERYYIADDCGTRLNPASVEGQVQGGVAQGTGAALLEEYVYDDGGQPLATTFADYLMPTVYDVPMTEKHAVVTPSPNTPFGVKGTGEGAIHVTPAAIFCAVNDALAPLGVELTHANAKPERVWRLLQESSGGSGQTVPLAK
jgi:CO/xanthine dehydrogenase Mo-binding subunit